MKKSKPPFEMKCNKCGKPQVPNKEKSNHNWIVFDANQFCECGGKFVLWVGGKPISEAKQDG